MLKRTFLLVFVLCLIAPFRVAHASDNFVTLNLPKGVSVELPKNWVPFGSDETTTLDTYVESVQGREALRSNLEFAANYYMRGKTVGIFNIRYYDEIDISQQGVALASAADISELDSGLKNSLVQSMSRVDGKILSWDGTTMEVVNGLRVFITQYSRRSFDKKGAFVVRLFRVFANEKSFTITVSYDENLSMVMGPIIDRIISSIRMDGYPKHVESSKGGSDIGFASMMSMLHGDYWFLVLAVSLIITWSIGLAPPVVIRYFIAKRPLSKGAAIGVCAAFVFINMIIFTALGSESKTHYALIMIAFVSYWILRKQPKGAPA